MLYRIFYAPAQLTAMVVKSCELLVVEVYSTYWIVQEDLQFSELKEMITKSEKVKKKQICFSSIMLFDHKNRINNMSFSKHFITFLNVV